MPPEPQVPLRDLAESDVLLYHGTGTLAKLIRFFDGTDVSHAGLYRADGTVAEALGGGLERRAVAESARHNAWLRVLRLRSRPGEMAPVASVADRYLATPNRYGYEQILLLALLGASRRLPVTPALAPLLRKALDSAAGVLARLAGLGREPLICSEFVYRCYVEAGAGDQDPYDLAIAGVAAPRGARGVRAPRAGRRVEPGSAIDQLRRTRGGGTTRALAAPRPRAPVRGSLTTLGERYLREASRRGSARGRRSLAARGGPLPLAEVEPELVRFGAALARARSPRPRAAPSRRAPAPGPRARAVSALSRAVADFVTPGDLLKSTSLATLGRLDLGAPAPRGFPQLHLKGAAVAKLALCIGINDYPGTGNDLAGCVNDAKDWGAAFKDRGFTVARLLNRDATGKNMRESIREVIAKARSGDVVAIQYSGHGSFVPDENSDESDGTDECLCPHDVNTKGEITDDELFTLYSSRQPGVRVIVFSDSCHSGTVAKFAPIRTPPTIRGRSAPQRKVRFLPPAAFLPKATLKRMGIRRGPRRSSPPGRFGALLMAGCQDTEYSYDAYFEGRPNGAFTFVALRALKGLPKSATYRDWFTKIRKTLPSPQYAQSPNLYGSSTMKKWKVLL